MLEYLRTVGDLFIGLGSDFGHKLAIVVALMGIGVTLLTLANFSERSYIKNNWRSFANTGTGLTTTGVVMLLNLDGWQPATTKHVQGMYVMTAFVLVMVAIMGTSALLSSVSDVIDRIPSPANFTHYLSNLLSSNKPVTTLRNGEPATVHHLAPRGMATIDLGTRARPTYVDYSRQHAA